MTEGTFTLYVRKILNNPIMGRKQVAVEMVHPGLANVSKAQIRDELTKRLKSDPERISVFGLKTKFGGGFSSGFALIYNSLEDRKKYDSLCSLRRAGMAGKRKVPRKMYKELKGKQKKVTGTAKAKVTTGKKKK